MGCHVFNVGYTRRITMNKIIIFLMLLSVFSQATTTITLATTKHADSSIISKKTNDPTKVITLKSQKEKAVIPPNAIIINQKTALYLPPSANIVTIEPNHQKAASFANEVKSHYDGSFLIYGTTFLLVGFSLFSK